MSDHEPEYRRRRREEAEQNQRYADREWDEATKDAQVNKIIIAIKGVVEKLERAEDKETPKNKDERRWKKREVLGLWAAAAVGVAAIVVGNIDASHQRDVMQRQLDEMRKQRIATAAQLRASMTREQRSVNPIDSNNNLAGPGEQIAGWIISPSWTNAGSTSAIEWRGWYDLRVFSAPPNKRVGPFQCPPSQPPTPLPKGRTIVQGGTFLQLAKKILVADALSAKEGTSYILMWGHAEYRDEFPDTPLHYDDWCVGIIPVDLQRSKFSFLEVSDDNQ